MILRKFLIAGGNPTLLVWGCPSRLKSKIIKQNLGKVDQVGFVYELPSGTPRLEMMGNELCINATLALAFQLSQKGELITSGVKNPVEYFNTSEATSIKLFLSFKTINGLVLFKGIGFLCVKTKVKVPKRLLLGLTRKYKLPAFGIVSYNKSKIIPYVYVQKTGSLLRETACGSGSIALSIINGIIDIVQPTGEIIAVRQSNQRFTVKTKVVKIEEKEL